MLIIRSEAQTMREIAKQQSSNKPPSQRSFELNEFYETLLRIKRDQPRRYARNIGAGTQRCVCLYAEQKILATRKAA